MRFRRVCAVRQSFALRVLLVAVIAMLTVVPSAVAEMAHLSITMDFPDYRILDTPEGQKIMLDDFGMIFEPGTPRIPSRIYPIALPPGAVAGSIRVISLQADVLPGTFTIVPVVAPRLIKDDAGPDPAMAELFDRNFTTVYGSDEPYPAVIGEYVRSPHYRKYNLVDVRITPFSYRPRSGQLTFHRRISIEIDYSLGETDGSPVGIVDDVPSMEREARSFIYNYDDARRWYPETIGQKDSQHPLVIITLASLVDAVAPLVAWETSKGENPQVVTTEWIYSNYSGVDDAQKIRNFLRDKYLSAAWGIENVLIVGHHNEMPMRLVWQNISSAYGRPRSDFYYAELSKADNQSWDSNQNGYYGENYDTMDFYSEVNIGRIPWSDFNTVQTICQKSVQYEQHFAPSYKKNILLLGGYFWADTDNAVLMEAKVNQSWMSDWNIVRLYEKNQDYWSSYNCDYPLLRANVQNVWANNTFAFVNWAGHGSPTSSHIYGLGAPAFIVSSDCPLFSNEFPAIVFADACSNSDTDELNIGQALMKRGAVGFVGATKVAYGCPGWSHSDDGSSQTLDYYFTKDVTSHEYSQGAAHQRSMRYLYTHGLWYDNHYEMAEWNLWGHPGLGMKTVVIQETPAMSLTALAILAGMLSLLLWFGLRRIRPAKSLHPTN